MTTCTIREATTSEPLRMLTGSRSSILLMAKRRIDPRSLEAGGVALQAMEVRMAVDGLAVDRFAAKAGHFGEMIDGDAELLRRLLYTIVTAENQQISSAHPRASAAHLTHTLSSYPSSPPPAKNDSNASNQTPEKHNPRPPEIQSLPPLQQLPRLRVPDRSLLPIPRLDHQPVVDAAHIDDGEGYNGRDHERSNRIQRAWDGMHKRDSQVRRGRCRG